MDCTTVITTYNRRGQVVAAVRSALRVLVRRPIVVVDDASTDDSLEVIRREFADEIAAGTVRLVALDRNLGVTAAKNAGYAAASAGWVIFLDSDDCYVDGAGSAIDAQLNSAVARPLIFFRCVDQTGRFVGSKQGESVSLDLPAYLAHTSYGEALTAINKAVVGEIAPYDAALRGYEGLGCCRIIRDHGPALLSDVVARQYDLGGGDRLSTVRGLLLRMPRLAAGHMQMLREFGAEMSVWKRGGYVLKATAYRVLGLLYSILLPRKAQC